MERAASREGRSFVAVIPTLSLKPREDDRIRAGHLWVFRNELRAEPQGLQTGQIVRVTTSEGTSLGTGFYHSTSNIAVRMVGGEVETIDEAFFEQRLRAANELRQRMLPAATAYRMVFGEADLMSGLIIDRYDDVCVVQMLAAGMDIHRDMIVAAIRQVLPSVNGIIERNTATVREKEGLELRDGVLWGTVPPTVDIVENGITYRIDVAGGQKTGYFLDQRTNRAWVGSVSAGKRVLDCFCNAGGFALNAAAGGAALALGVDSSAPAVEAAARNAEINGFANVQFEKANVFDLLRREADMGRTWDIIVLDPPSFAKSRSAVPRAQAGYAELNRAAMRILAPGGILVSASCTQLVPEAMLMDIIYIEAARLRRRLRLLHRGEQGLDHPILLAMPETHYLKFLAFDVLSGG